MWVLHYKRVLRRVLRRGSEKGGFQKVPRTPPCRVRPLRRAPYFGNHPFANPRDSGRKAPLSCNAAASMLRRSFSDGALMLALQSPRPAAEVPNARH